MTAVTMTNAIAVKRKLSDCEDDLHEAAIAQTGLHDFGDPAYRDAFRALLDGFDTDVKVSERGLEFVYNYYFLSPLTARLYAEKGWAENPHVLSMPIKKPVVIIGLPRSGTTALHRLLSMDPQFQGVEFWLAQKPQIRPPRESWKTNPSYRAAVAHSTMMISHMPGMIKAHDILADEVEECKKALCQSFLRYELAPFLRSYGRFYQTHSHLAAYRRYADILRLIGSGEPDRRWLLKENYHMTEMDNLFDIFPDACIIQTHRDPLKTIPSLCSLWYMLEHAIHGENARPEAIGPREAPFWRKALDRADEARRGRASQFFDVDHRDFEADALGTVRSIYRYFGLTLSPLAEQNMREWIVASPTTKNGPHEYAGDKWGITSTELRDLYEDYRKEHGFN
ncbi:sulfotransferase [Phyllobacterium phragmitis]|uniref:Sulfotransferase n=1 Tax=Phyllobacterium phragmitis TaxID=2670329 RepID=A0A2S9IJK0_9HYPH|nr:sulfotransferase [Phyllobacterium phragmitis]PRD40697.1 sulfotransferase [Phyllobacterium phragmitis]